MRQLALFIVSFAAAAAAANGSSAASSGAAVQGDAVRGLAVYSRCAGCHSIDQNRIGPKHRGVVGSKAGGVPDYAYSDALKNSKVVWTPRNLDVWLAGPIKFIPGTRMGFSLSSAQDRADVIAYLATQR